MYDFLLRQYILKRIDATYIRRCVPKFLTEEEAELIIATPQGGE